MFGHRNCFGRFRTYTGVPGVTGTPRGVYWAYWALLGEEEGWPRQPRAPPPIVRIGQGIEIPTIKSRESNIPMTKGTMYDVIRFD